MNMVKRWRSEGYTNVAILNKFINEEGTAATILNRLISCEEEETLRLDPFLLLNFTKILQLRKLKKMNPHNFSPEQKEIFINQLKRKGVTDEEINKIFEPAFDFASFGMQTMEGLIQSVAMGILVYRGLELAKKFKDEKRENLNHD